MRVEVTPYFENTTQQAFYINENQLRAYYITPMEGYVLHDKALDMPEYFEGTTEETGNIILGYTTGTISVGYNYNFEENPREIYAVLRETIPDNQIFGGGDDKEHEVM